ncbi:MAG: hypothetical protein ACK4NZ_15235 [Tsuneonella sp.]
MLRAIHLALAAIAMLLAPMAMHSGMVMAAAPVEHHAAAAPSGHCDGGESNDDDRSGQSMQSCVAMCSALAPTGIVPVDVIVFADPRSGWLPDTDQQPFLAELPTPPPRAG